jgi:single-strand DNA-binding protein
VIVSGRLDQRTWENQEGEKRSKVEITADEVSPSLRWATVDITKNERRTPDGSGNGGSGYRPVANEPAPGYQSYEEEPF